jgi:hypothetical protein
VSNEPRYETWCGGVIRARSYASHGRYRPEIAAWILPSGELVGARLAAPGEGVRALGRALRAGLREQRERPPSILTVQAPDLLPVLEKICSLPIFYEPHEWFELMVEENLDHVTGLGYDQGYLDRGVTRELARQLFVTSNAFLGLDLVHLEQHHVCAVELPSLAPTPMVVWIGSEPAWIGSGWRMFRSLDHFRSYMLVAVYGWTARQATLSVLGLGHETVRFLNPKQRRDIQREDLPLAKHAIAPVLVATDGDNVRRPYDGADVAAVVLITRALNEAFERGAPEGEVELWNSGAVQRGRVWLRHPAAHDKDLHLIVGAVAR